MNLIDLVSERLIILRRGKFSCYNHGIKCFKTISLSKNYIVRRRRREIKRLSDFNAWRDLAVFLDGFHIHGKKRKRRCSWPNENSRSVKFVDHVFCMLVVTTRRHHPTSTVSKLFLHQPDRPCHKFRASKSVLGRS